VQVHYHVYKVIIREADKGAGLRIEQWEFGTHHRFIAYFRDPRAIVYLHRELGRAIQANKWENLPAQQEASGPLPPKREEPGDSEGEVAMGSCCGCGSDENVRNVIMLPKKAPRPDGAWGCVVCGLPNEGAIAVMCDACIDTKQEPIRACFGAPGKNNRIDISKLVGDHEHDNSKHKEDERNG